MSSLPHLILPRTRAGQSHMARRRFYLSQTRCLLVGIGAARKP